MSRALLLALLLLPGLAGAQSRVEIATARAFPGNDGAALSTLDAPLADLLKAYLQKAKKKRFAKRIVVHKARRRLDVYADEALIKSYVVNLGLSPEGTKEREGDMRTPEGDYYLCAKNRVSQFTRFLGISYPTVADAERARKANLIPAKAVEATRAAWKARDRCPPQTTPLGGAVGIHGKGGWEKQGEAFVGMDWTFGCIGLRDQDIHELFDHYAEVGVPVQILAE